MHLAPASSSLSSAASTILLLDPRMLAAFVSESRTLGKNVSGLKIDISVTYNSVEGEAQSAGASEGDTCSIQFVLP